VSVGCRHGMVLRGRIDRKDAGRIGEAEVEMEEKGKRRWERRLATTKAEILNERAGAKRIEVVASGLGGSAQMRREGGRKGGRADDGRDDEAVKEGRGRLHAYLCGKIGL